MLTQSAPAADADFRGERASHLPMTIGTRATAGQAAAGVHRIPSVRVRFSLSDTLSVRNPRIAMPMVTAAPTRLWRRVFHTARTAKPLPAAVPHGVPLDRC